MTSPYLQRPKRSLHQAIRDTGRSPDEVGVNGAKHAQPQVGPAHPKGPFRLTGFHMVLGAIVCAAILTGGLLLSWREQHEAPIAEKGIESETEIVPAAGPPGTDTDETDSRPAEAQEALEWENAPTLEPPSASQTTAD